MEPLSRESQQGQYFSKTQSVLNGTQTRKIEETTVFNA